MQRVFDVLLSLLAIIILLPLLLPIVISLRFTGERKVFYLQYRVGKGGKLFRIIKFATMLENSPHMGSGTITEPNDPRVLPVGRVLRKTKLNELPQLVNVLIGDMSLIGPRPMTQNEYIGYTASDFENITSVKPGLSGIGSIYFRDEQRLLERFGNTRLAYQQHIAPYKAQLEIWYIKNKSIFLYFILIFLTICYVIHPNHNLLSKFFTSLPKEPKIFGSSRVK